MNERKKLKRSDYRQLRLQFISLLLLALCGVVSTIVLLLTEWIVFQGWFLRTMNIMVISAFFYTFVYKSLIKAKYIWRQMENMEGKIDEV